MVESGDLSNNLPPKSLRATAFMTDRNAHRSKSLSQRRCQPCRPAMPAYMPALRRSHDQTATLTIFDVTCKMKTPCNLRLLRQSEVFRYCPFQVQEKVAMRLTNQNLDQLQTIFGDEFVREHHSEPTGRYLSQLDVYGVIRSLVGSLLNRVLKALRSALTLR